MRTGISCEMKERSDNSNSDPKPHTDLKNSLGPEFVQEKQPAQRG
ncbi:hypothetical protein cpu_03550 [Carboxydothermus pertinax]|uniref:Uncharacterized protein n=1 Tax=Carboxydothermus pertinax TaxID=870242 RepID=A0A1L8CSD2_9THEO|nr:hypothetical protein cpu_03550 [Carboxydothermus pertinax]